MIRLEYSPEIKTRSEYSPDLKTRSEYSPEINPGTYGRKILFLNFELF